MLCHRNRIVRSDKLRHTQKRSYLATHQSEVCPLSKYCQGKPESVVTLGVTPKGCTRVLLSSVRCAVTCVMQAGPMLQREVLRTIALSGDKTRDVTKVE